MHHSIIISGKNTYTEWGIVPTSRPHIVPPEVKTSDVDLPSSHGVLDYTDLLLAETPYGQRKGSWEFVLKPGNRWADVYSSIMNYLHGTRHTVILEDDPDFLYTGRLQVNDWKSEERYSTITIDYNLDPFKYSVEASDDTSTAESALPYRHSPVRLQSQSFTVITHTTLWPVRIITQIWRLSRVIMRCISPGMGT